MADLALSRDQYLEFEKLAVGAFSPLEGFMNEDQFNRVVETMRLPDGQPFPLPVVLGLDRGEARRIRGRPRVTLIYGGEEVGTLVPESIFTCDKPSAAKRIYGTDDHHHPGVRCFLRGGESFVGGPITLTRRAVPGIARYDLTPEESRRAFAERGWRTVAGFQTRNVPHRAHEYLQRFALELVDGLFLHPLVGRRKKGDYTPEAIVAGYQALIETYYPKDRVVFGLLTTAMHYAGPRESIFHAIVRRNYGCTHFVVGRDHAGVGNYYGKYDAHELTRRFDGDLGIEILRLHGPHHCALCGGTVTERTCPHGRTNPEAVTPISGSDMRELLARGATPGPHLMRPEVVAALGRVPLFIGDDKA